MKKGLFVIIALIGLNFYLFKNNRDLALKVDQLDQKIKTSEEKLKRASRKITAVKLFFAGLLNKQSEEVVRKFDEVINEIGDPEIQSRYHSAKDSNSADDLLRLSDFICEKSLSDLKE